MSNLTIEAPLGEGRLMSFFDEGEACNYAVTFIAGDDLRPPPKSVNITVKTKSGKLVKLVIPNDLSSAIVMIDGEIV
jgi:hypothetical protein